jgi:hypothetical protein
MKLDGLAKRKTCRCIDSLVAATYELGSSSHESLSLHALTKKNMAWRVVVRIIGALG